MVRVPIPLRSTVFSVNCCLNNNDEKVLWTHIPCLQILLEFLRRAVWISNPTNPSSLIAFSSDNCEKFKSLSAAKSIFTNLRGIVIFARRRWEKCLKHASNFEIDWIEVNHHRRCHLSSQRCARAHRGRACAGVVAISQNGRRLKYSIFCKYSAVVILPFLAFHFLPRLVIRYRESVALPYFYSRTRKHFFLKKNIISWLNL